jgi:hypothetical protein
MMDNTLTKSGSNGDWVSISKGEYTKQLEKLAEKWRSSHEVDLNLRHQTGVLLNQRFGNPTDPRQKRGKKVLKVEAKRLQITESELSWMRRFAFYFKSFKGFKQKYSKVTTWTKVKEMLPKLNLNGGRLTGNSLNGGAYAAVTQGKKSQKFRCMKHSLIKLVSKIEETPGGLLDKERREMVEILGRLAKTLKKCLKIRISVDQLSAAQKPLATRAA